MIPILDPDQPVTRYVLHRRIVSEPAHRISKAQRDSMRAIARRDPSAKVEGLDWKFLPVIYGRSSGPNGPTKYSLRKNGEATPVNYADKRSKRLAETWR